MSTQTTTPNPHQPAQDGHRLACAADGCSYAMHTYRNPAGGEPDWTGFFRRQHTAQFDTGRAQDITVDFAVEASCSVCTDGIGSVKMCDDGDAVCCGDCGTHWNMDGTGGELEEHSDADDPIDDPAATGGLLDALAGLTGTDGEQPPIACEQCDFETNAITAAMAHVRRLPDHVISGAGRIEGTTLRISTGDDEDDDDDDDWAEG